MPYVVVRFDVLAIRLVKFYINLIYSVPILVLFSKYVCLIIEAEVAFLFVMFIQSRIS